jgi:preprotein translocase subunit SecG
MIILPLILVAAVVAVVLILTGGSSNNAASNSSGSASVSASSTSAAKASKGSKRHKAAAVTVTPSSVTLAVLNGTSTNHLAATVLGKLTTAGYKGSFTQNAAETAVTSTVVGYTAPSDRADALAVAKSLSLGSASVQSASQADRAKVCGATTAACTTQVIVTAGTDLAQAG